MSLLLDALKKAADDKEKSSRDSSTESPGSAFSTRVGKNTEQDIFEPSDTEGSGEVPLDKRDYVGTKTETKSETETAADNEIDVDGLTLDLEEISEIDNRASEETSEHQDSVQREPADKGADRSDSDRLNNSGQPRSSREAVSEDKVEARHRISDDALSLLIDKTNREVKKGKRVSIAILVIATLAILLSAGAYYYTDMQAEIAAIERKHQIAMQSMRAKTNRETTPQQSEIIKNLVSDAELEEKVEYARAQMQSDKRQATEVKKPAVSKNKVSTAELSIKRTNKTDPVAEKLDAAWLAYDDAHYDDAENLYKEVLEIEKKNRDALLGMGAIAVVQKDEVKARQIYLSLLQQDPRDPIATAALSGLSGNASSLQEDNEYLMSILEKNPDAPHLNFSLANNFAQQNKWKSAQQYYFKAWQHDIENADYLFNLAVSMDQLGKSVQALGFYRDSLNKAQDKQVSFSREAVQKRIDELTQL